MNGLVHGFMIVLLIFAIALYVQPVRTGAIIVFSNRIVKPMRFSGGIFSVFRLRFFA